MPSPVAGAELALTTRMTVIGIAASSGGMIAWFNLFESKNGGALVWIIGCIGGVAGAAVAYFTCRLRDGREVILAPAQGRNR